MDGSLPSSQAAGLLSKEICPFLPAFVSEYQLLSSEHEPESGEISTTLLDLFRDGNVSSKKATYPFQLTITILCDYNIIHYYL